MKLFSTQLFFCFLSLVSYSQEQEGIKFTEAKNWKELQAEAKKNNKYIFLDIYTTWCAPCKFMSKEIFPIKEVGSFFNANFINAAIQFDKTKTDNDFIKGWYNDAKLLETKFSINSYPTYLFFNPVGELVYRIDGAFENANNFISKASNALIPDKQYYRFKSKYENGDRNINLIKQLLNSANEEKDIAFLTKVGNDYLQTQKNIYTKENIEIIKLATTKSTDQGFYALRFHSSIIDSILGKGASSKIVFDIIANEIVIPYLRNGGTKTDMGGGMIMYSGDINKNVNWDVLELKLKEKYPELANKIILSAKPQYYDWIKDWNKFSETSISNINSYPELLDDNLLNYYMWQIIRNSEEKRVLLETIKWVKNTTAVKNKSNATILMGYANLLYKYGNKELALLTLQDAIETAIKNKQDNYASRLKSVVAMMEKGEKTW